MAREIHSRIHLSGTLLAQTPLHVGGQGGDVDTDLPLARNGMGQLYVPGTSVAGALREHCQRLFDESFTDRFWGYQTNDEGHASSVVIEDVVIDHAEDVVVEIRDGVGIDRQWGVAAEHIKYDRAILPRGTRMRLNLAVDVDKRENRSASLAMMASLKAAMEQGLVKLGAAKTRGLGLVRLEGGQLTERNFGTRQGILSILRQREGIPLTPDELDQAQKAHPSRPLPRLGFVIRWRSVGPLMVKSGFDGIAVDMLPLTSGVDGQVAVVLPGSSMKGAVRSQAERIIRTLLDRDVSRVNDPKQRFLKDCELPLINDLFGQRGQEMLEDESQKWLPGLGALRVNDCFGTQHLDTAQWQAVQAAQSDSDLRNALDATGLQSWNQGYHAAVDRWTGAAADSMLYSVLEPHSVEWEPLVIEIDLQRLQDDDWQVALALMLLLVRDLSQQRLPIGFGTHRGMGTVRVDAVEFAVQHAGSALELLKGVILSGGRLSELPTELRHQLNAAWESWIARHCQEVTA